MIKKILIIFIILLASTKCWATDYTASANCMVGLLMKVDENPLTDSCGEGNTGALRGAGEPNYVTDAPSGYAEGSYDFDGADDWIDVAADATIDNLANFTWIGWVNADNLGENSLGRLFDKGGAKVALIADGGGSKWEVQVTITTDGTNRTAISSTTLFFNTWYHIMITYASGTAPKIYVNGGEMSYTSQADGTGSDADDSAGALRIGNTAEIRSFNGSMTEVGFFNSVLSTTNMSEIEDCSFDGSLCAAAARRVMVIQ